MVEARFSSAWARVASSSAWNSGLSGRPVTWSNSVRETVRAWAAKAAARPMKFFHHASSLRVSAAVGKYRRPSFCRAAASRSKRSPVQAVTSPRTRPSRLRRSGPAPSSSGLVSTQRSGMR